MRLSLTVLERVQGLVIYRGPSRINGKPIVAVATNLDHASKNEKTGAVVQVYILSDERQTPLKAILSGRDESVCGDCIHRRVNGWGTCYVNAGRGPGAVYAAYRRGVYRTMEAADLERFAGRVVRLGAYGDPAAVPVAVWESVLERAAGWLGYSHAWRTCDQSLRRWCMASVETAAQAARAKRRGWKTFRVLGEGEELQPGEFACPASAEQGKRLTCERCRACRGGEYKGQATPAIKVHGLDWKARRYRKMQLRMRRHQSYRTLVP
jgi:hypothetical protein